MERGVGVLDRRTSRRGFLVKAAMAGTALAVAPLRYLLQPVSAHTAICGCGTSECGCDAACCDGYTEFCCAVNNGLNACPEGTFPGGWWRADGSIFCDGTRYIVDCNTVGDPACTCECAHGDCDRRSTCCTWFRYGQCNPEVESWGPIVCRMVTCEPPHLLDLGCHDEAFWDDSTANHTTDCPAASGPAATPAPSEGLAPEDDLDPSERSRLRRLDRDERSRQRQREIERRRLERAGQGQPGNG